MFTNAKGERFEAVELETEDTKYLVKVSAQLTKKVEVFIDEQDDADLEDDTLPNTDEVPDEDADTDD
jgi:ribosomal protein S16